jgi:hypothetical protein
MVAVASVSGRLTLGPDGGPTEVGPPGGAPLASEKLVNASSVTAPARVVRDSSPITPLVADAAWGKIGPAATTPKAATATAVALADIA